MAITVQIDEANDEYRLTSNTGESGPIADVGDPAILISSEGVFYCLLEDAEDEPDVFCSTGAEPVNAITEDVTFTDNADEDIDNGVQVETGDPAD